MSYCRFSDESDVYVYVDPDDVYICCGCSHTTLLDHTESTIDGMIEHLNIHVSNGEKVPQKVFDRLNEERF